jgi:hypothetical protein
VSGLAAFSVEGYATSCRRKDRAARDLIVISGGQTGVDRGALDAALEAHAPCGGWCPEGRKAEDGPIPARYPLRELPGGSYTQRTRQNVADSDRTLVLTFGLATGGTARTIEFCRRLGKPHLIVDAAATSLEDAERLAVDFVRTHAIERPQCRRPEGEHRGERIRVRKRLD